MQTKTETLRAIPKEDIDRMFALLKPVMNELHPNPKSILQKLRGIAYANTLNATHTYTVCEAA